MLGSIHALPRRVLFLLALCSLGVGVWASRVNLDFFKHGALLLEADPTLQELVKTAAYLFITAEMAGFLLTSFLPGKELRTKRWFLLGACVAIVIFDVFVVTAVNIAGARHAEDGQSANAQQISDLKQRISSIEATAATMAAAAKKETNSRHSWIQSKAADDARAAAGVKSTAEPLYVQLAAAQAKTAPVILGVFCSLDPSPDCAIGRGVGIGFVVVRGVLVSVIGLAFFGAAGAFLRAFMGQGATTTPKTALEPVQPVSQPVSSVKQTQAPGHAEFKIPGKWGQVWPASVLAGVLGSITGTPNNAQAAAVPMVSPSSPAMSTQIPPSMSAQTPRPRKTRTATTGSKVDTGTSERDGSRYQRIKAAVVAGHLRPSLNAIQRAEGGGAPVIRRYLAAMAEEGIIEPTPDGKGWQIIRA